MKNEDNINIIDPGIQNEQPKKQEGAVGPIIGSIIIIALIVLGGLYYWGSIINSNQKNEDVKAEETIPALSESDEIIDIEEDLEATNLNEIDELLNDIDVEIDDALNNL
jgi:hypothetical protein